MMVCDILVVFGLIYKVPKIVNKSFMEPIKTGPSALYITFHRSTKELFEKYSNQLLTHTFERIRDGY